MTDFDYAPEKVVAGSLLFENTQYKGVISMDMIDSINDANRKFQFYFKIDAKRFMDPLTTGIKQRFDLNIIAFDDWLHRQGYSERKDGSMRDYIKAVYGKSAALYIEGVLK